MSITDQGLHILTGTLAAQTWNMAFEADERLLVLRDDLTCGPLRTFEHLSEWIGRRQSFWNRIIPESAECFREYDNQSMDSVRASAPARLHDAASIYLWAGSTVGDQLFFLFTVHFIENAGVDPEKIQFVPFEVRPHHSGPFISVGTCSIGDLKHHPEPVRMTSATLKTCQRAWKAITGETPSALVEAVSPGAPAAPYVLTNLLNRYPQHTSGLTLWDHMLLKRVVTNGPNAAQVIAWVLCDTWDSGDCVGDAYLFHRLKQLADPQLPEPLLELTGNMDNCRGAEVTFTDFGHAVLEGRASNYPTNPIDEWIGGVHLSSEEGNLWMYNDSSLQKVPAE